MENYIRKNYIREVGKLYPKTNGTRSGRASNTGDTLASRLSQMGSYAGAEPLYELFAQNTMDVQCLWAWGLTYGLHSRGLPGLV